MTERTQDVDRWIAELRAAGWTEHRLNVWRSPHGLLYRGPWRAWKVMSDPDYERSNE